MIGAEEITVWNSVSLGNVITIITFIFGFITTIITISSKMSKFIAVTEMKFQAGEKKFTEHDTQIRVLDERCKTCYLQKEVSYLKEERERMNSEQVILRGRLPLQLETMSSDISEIKNDIASIKNSFAQKGIIIGQ
jgi:hypothetical protein